MVWCEALLTMLSFTEISNVWAVRLTDMSNICESLHHRNKEIAYGYLQAIAKRRAVKMALSFSEPHGCSTAGGWADSKSVVSYLYGTW